MPPPSVPREMAKGTRLYMARAATPTVFVRSAGVVGINGPNRTRANVDATELDTSPDTLPGGAVEENYFYKLNEPGTKEVQAISLDLNMNQAQYAIFNDIYDDDETCLYEIRFRSGAKLTWSGYIESLGADSQSDQLVKTPATFMPHGKVLYVAAP